MRFCSAEMEIEYKRVVIEFSVAPAKPNEHNSKKIKEGALLRRPPILKSSSGRKFFNSDFI
jgi:hypothetical protein